MKPPSKAFLSIPGFFIGVLIMAIPAILEGQAVAFIEKVALNSQGDQWKITGKPVLYEGEKLYHHINGASDIYLEFGFVRAAVIEYTDARARTLACEIYEMASAAAAYGIYTYHQVEDCKSVRVGQEGSLVSSFLFFWKSKYFITLFGAEGDEALIQDILLQGKRMDSQIAETGQVPTIVHALPDILPCKVNYLKGDIALRNIYPFGWKNPFGFSEAVAGNYSSYHLFIMKYQDISACERHLQLAIDFLKKEKRYTEKEEFNGFPSFRDNKDNYLYLDFFEDCILLYLGHGLSPSEVEPLKILQFARRGLSTYNLSPLYSGHEWKLQDSVRVAQGEQLFDLIDGGADIFFEYGFRAAAFAEFVHEGGQKLRAEIYHMNDPAAAFGIYSMMRPASGRDIPIGDAGCIGGEVLVFRKGNHFVTLTMEGEQEGVRDALINAAGEISMTMDSSPAAPAIVAALSDGSGKNCRALFIRGNIALNNIYAFSGASLFDMKEGAVATCDSLVAMVIRYENTKKCSVGFEAAREKLQALPKFSGWVINKNSFRATDRKNNVLYFKPYREYIMILIAARELGNPEESFDSIENKLSALEDG